jgi:anthranilate synthase component 2
VVKEGADLNSPAPRLLVIDNYDSFTHNLVQMFMQYPLTIEVHRCDALSLTQAEEMDPDYILISPGPKDPSHTGISVPLITAFYKTRPILGVCLGMQCINEAFGGATTRAPLPTHGKTSPIFHRQTHLFKNIPSPFTAARYHSLMSCFDVSELHVTANSSDGIIMGLSHPDFPLHGVQFHPESFMTEYGFVLVENFLRLGRLKHPERSPHIPLHGCLTAKRGKP